MKKYTYREWLKGSVCLKSGEAINEKGKTIIPALDWDDFKQSAAIKIKAKQKEFFIEMKNRLFEKLKNEFSNRYENSLSKELCLERELKKINTILFSKQNLTASYVHIGLELTFEKGYIYDIRDYISNVIIGGKQPVYDSVWNPKCKMNHGYIFPAIVYAQAILEYCVMLREFTANKKNEGKEVVDSQIEVKETVDSKIKEKKSKKEKESRTLKDIWIEDKSGNKDQYDKIIEFLKRDINDIDRAFLSIFKGKDSWVKYPVSGWVQYLAGFIYTCIDRGWVTKDLTSTQYKDILCNTFNIIKVDKKPFKSIAVNPPKQKYLDPFLSIPENK